MADSSTPKPPQAPVLPGSTSEEAIDLVSVGEGCEVIEGEKAVGELETAEKEQEERETTTQDSNPLESLEESDVGIREEKDDDDKAEKEAVVEPAGSDREGVSESDSAHPEAAAAQGNQEEEQDVTSLCSPPPSASDSVAAPTSLSAAVPSSSTSTPTPPVLEVDSTAEELECPPGLDPPMSVTLLKPTTTPCEDGPLPLETVLPSQTTPASPPFSSSSHQDSYESDPTPQANLEQATAEYEDAQQEETGLFYGHAPEQPQYPHDPFHHHHHHHHPQPQRPFEPLPPSQLLSATISHALSLTPSSPQPQFQFRSHPGAANNNPSQLNFTPHKPSSRDVISGIAPHVFDERRRRRSTSKGRRNSGGRWYDAGYGGGGGGPGCRGRARGSPLRRSVVITWDERSIFLEEATQAGTVTSRISIDIATGHQRRDLSDSSCSSGSSGESNCSPTSSSASSIASTTKEKGMGGGKKKKTSLFGAGGSTAGPRWRGKFKLFRNIVSRMKSSRDTPVQAVAAH